MIINKKIKHIKIGKDIYETMINDNFPSIKVAEKSWFTVICTSNKKSCFPYTTFFRQMKASFIFF